MLWGLLVGGVPLLQVLSASVPIRWATAGCALHRQRELTVWRSSNRVVILSTAPVRCFVACCAEQVEVQMWVPSMSQMGVGGRLQVWSACQDRAPFGDR